jgi:hypothetical protein
MRILTARWRSEWKPPITQLKTGIKNRNLQNMNRATRSRVDVVMDCFKGLVGEGDDAENTASQSWPAYTTNPNKAKGEGKNAPGEVSEESFDCFEAGAVRWYPDWWAVLEGSCWWVE